MNISLIQVILRKRLLIISGLILSSSIACGVHNSEHSITAANSTASDKDTEESRLAPIKNSADAESTGSDQLSVLIPEVELGNELLLRAQITNNDSVPMIDGNFGLTYTVNYIIAPQSSFSGDVRRIVDETSEGRLIGEKDFFFIPIPEIEPNAVKEIEVAKFPLKRILDNFYFSEEQIPDAKPDLRIWAVVLEAHIIDRRAKTISKSKKMIYLAHDLDGKQTLFGYKKD